MNSNYDKFPAVRADAPHRCAWQNWPEILDVLRGEIARGARRIAIECYPGVYEDDLARVVAEGLAPCRILRTADCWKPAAEIDAMVARELTDDPVFGRMNGFVIDDFADPEKLARLRSTTDAQPLVILGAGTELIEPAPDLLIYADMARWEIQQRQRAGKIANLAADNFKERPSLQYKRAFFLDWRVADRIKKRLLPRCDYLLDTNDAATPKLVTGDAFRGALRHTVTRPFRVVPFFDPGPWGGQWMSRVCGLSDAEPNFAWCFDCVPEENSLLFDFGSVRIETPAIDLVFLQPRELLGDAVHGRFGTEFPIRFDFLDTMGGGNLSLQVHPLTEYIQDKFGMAYTQDESYYMLDTADDACVYLGLKEGVNRAEMIAGLRRAQEGGPPFPAEQYVNRWPARKHDHFLIPAGTIHCSGRNSMVLEISATPYIFTFKLWDWGRLGLDGRPRPIHLEHGLANIQWDRDTRWVRENLVGQVERLGPGEERTGLHTREFIETRRHWFSEPVAHNTEGGVHVLNLVEGDEAAVESPSSAFAPFPVHYAETFIVPAAVGAYTIGPVGRCATVRASVRTRP